MGKKVTNDRELLRQLIENIDDNIFFKDREHNFILINQANARWFGFADPSEAIGKNDFDFFDAEFAQKAFDDEERIMATGKPIKGKVDSAIYNGQLTWGSVTKVPIRDDTGAVCGIMGIGRDITALKQREAELENAHEQMARDLRVAASLQKAFLPNLYPSIRDQGGSTRIHFHHYYAACDQLSGDFCSIHQLSDTKAGLLICDVMGHGVRAALVTASIKAIASEISRTPRSAAAFLSRMNRRMFSLLQNADTLIFATASYAVIDVESGVLEFSVAGHSLPVHLHAQSGNAEEVCIPKGARGPALGLQQDFDYHNSEIQLQAGDSLLLYTDGLVEAVGPGGKEFGINHLLDAVSQGQSKSLQDLVESIVGRLKQFRGNGHFDDDVCLLGFRLDG